jgi:hypothetical protein
LYFQEVLQRDVGVITGSEISKQYGEAGLPENTINVYTNGHAGQYHQIILYQHSHSHLQYDESLSLSVHMLQDFDQHDHSQLMFIRMVMLVKVLQHMHRKA